MYCQHIMFRFLPTSQQAHNSTLCNAESSKVLGKEAFCSLEPIYPLGQMSSESGQATLRSWAPRKGAQSPRSLLFFLASRKCWDYSLYCWAKALLPSAQSSSCFQCTLFSPTFYYENLKYPENLKESPSNNPWDIFLSYCPSPAWLLYSYPLLQATFFKRLFMGNLWHGKSVLCGSSRWSPGLLAFLFQKGEEPGLLLYTDLVSDLNPSTYQLCEPGCVIVLLWASVCLQFVMGRELTQWT